MPKTLPRGIWMLGFESLFMDVSSGMIDAVLTLLGLLAVKPHEHRHGEA